MKSLIDNSPPTTVSCEELIGKLIKLISDDIAHIELKKRKIAGYTELEASDVKKMESYYKILNSQADLDLRREELEEKLLGQMTSEEVIAEIKKRIAEELALEAKQNS